MPRTVPPGLAAIQDPVRESLEGVVTEMRRIAVSDYRPLADVSDYILLKRGKLFRPTLVILASRVEGGESRDAQTVAALVELVHLATLVHDDAVDHSVMRRGMPTVNALWNHRTAIIMGDFLYSRSVSRLSELGDLEQIGVLARAANRMSVGELRALHAADALDLGEDAYYRLIAAKTASLISASCELGSLVGGGVYRESLARYGHELGMAFQIVDDVIDYVATERATGKPSGHDLREHKVTLPLIEALPEMSDPELRSIERFFADPRPTETGIAEVIALVQARGGVERAQARAEAYGEAALDALSDLPRADVTEALRLAVAYVVCRRA
ncbi:MAG TPA: polyprenyl synthetase family protein [Longimicrobiales bacterium]|nr:polyprenyl synthetase family protein [Longimicrobiales bacterium]